MLQEQGAGKRMHDMQKTRTETKTKKKKMKVKTKKKTGKQGARGEGGAGKEAPRKIIKRRKASIHMKRKKDRKEAEKGGE